MKFLADLLRSSPLMERENAACLGMDPNIFFDETRTELAKAICYPCELWEECLELGMTNDFGVWGGLTRRERKELINEAPSPVEVKWTS